MTPAQLDALSEVHASIHDGKGRHRSTPSTNPAADLAALAAL